MKVSFGLTGAFSERCVRGGCVEIFKKGGVLVKVS